MPGALPSLTSRVLKEQAALWGQGGPGGSGLQLPSALGWVRWLSWWPVPLGARAWVCGPAPLCLPGSVQRCEPPTNDDGGRERTRKGSFGSRGEHCFIREVFVKRMVGPGIGKIRVPRRRRGDSQWKCSFVFWWYWRNSKTRAWRSMRPAQALQSQSVFKTRQRVDPLP